MIKIKNLLSSIFLIGIVFNTWSQQNQNFKPLGVPGNWAFQKQFSDEFKGSSINNKWSKNVDNWPAWSSDPTKVKIRNNKLIMSIAREDHFGNGQKQYFKSGILISKNKIKYGYFEVKMKGVGSSPGASPAFWLYSKVRNSNVKYIEIDCPEIQFKVRDNDVLGWNVVNIKNNNERISIRQETGCLNKPDNVDYCFPKPRFDPSNRFHVYGCNWTPNKIEFFIDGKKVGKTINNSVHKHPMSLVISLGLREPFYTYSGIGPGTRIPVDPDTVRPRSILNGFPMKSEVEYVRVWKKKPGNNANIRNKNGALNLEKKNENKFNIFQNNSSKLINVNISEDVNSLDVKVYNLSGKLIYENTFNNNNTFRLSTHTFQNGIYIIKVIDDEQKTYTKKIIIK